VLRVRLFDKPWLMDGWAYDARGVGDEEEK
jgi:hypothetical protein